ncbi:MAG TPA: hypothetical protein VMW56_12655 [Candidatus Margulisiibacteriota bacterium]|nr:hypothetical protein [Candidatus Margulisiibacteriota bacterium]
MEPGTDPRMRILVEVNNERLPRELLEWLLHSFDALEQTDFGELEPVGVAAPTVIGSDT